MANDADWKGWSGAMAQKEKGMRQSLQHFKTQP
jgi:hypothetical protein